MKHPIESYNLYRLSKVSVFTIRIKVLMKEEVDAECLRRAVNIATRRYPYFMVKVRIGDDGAYVFEPNDNDIAVFATSAKNPELCTKETGYHLLYADYEGKTIYFNISHALAGGRGSTPWVMTCVYQYIVEKYGVHPDAPAIRKPGSDFIPNETAQPVMEMTDGAQKLPKDRFRGSRALIKDYLNGILNPFVSSNEYFQIEFEQKDIMKFAKGSDNSVLSLFHVLMFKTMAKLFPKDKIFVGQSPHNPSEDLGIPGTYVNVLTHVNFPFTEKMKDWDVERLGTAARGNMIPQIDPLFSLDEMRQIFNYYEGIDSVDGYKQKKKYAKKHNLTFSSDAVRFAYIVSYTGYLDWGEVADYMDAYYYVVDGHQMLEISALKDKIFCCYEQVIRTDKYINAFKQVLEEQHIPYKISGPYKKNLTAHKLPTL